MTAATIYPAIMRHAAEDLTATVEGQFSPEDWSRILQQAERTYETLRLREENLSEGDAWQEVVRDFYRSSYWGFRPNYRAPKKTKAKKNLGATFIWMSFNSLVTFKVAVLWFGQVYSRSDEPKDKWIFFALIALVVGNFVYFLWKHHDHPDN